MERDATYRRTIGRYNIKKTKITFSRFYLNTEALERLFKVWFPSSFREQSFLYQHWLPYGYLTGTIRYACCTTQHFLTPSHNTIHNWMDATGWYNINQVWDGSTWLELVMLTYQTKSKYHTDALLDRMIRYTVHPLWSSMATLVILLVSHIVPVIINCLM